ncbi:hypothetical protein [Cyanobacterium sp. Dongsha4]|uniref:hypothetical protein n=1 Tax=Cyanobacterium sp. DS4 TaxID=2878255 RepID=UPI000F1A1BCC|nr:hypothetical protein [Cyanobacterium sp. Dongsha4]RMD66944.1 MAG: hypothetical protein D6822_08920 [Cyanobacteria bacterium J149]WVL01741.1 hypothetical protein Dongsha4_06005 [Cyanobacterium sp. Dongsha4]
MSEPENLLQKAFYLGVGIAGFAVEKANDALQELKEQADKLVINGEFPHRLQQIADEMVNKGKMNTEEARKFVDEILQQQNNQKANKEENSNSSEPRIIEIITDEEEDKA